MLRVFSVVYWTFFAITMPFIFAVSAIVWALTVLFDRRRIVYHLFSCAWGSFYVYANPIWRLRTTGRERLPWKGPAVLVSNHASTIDILVLYSLYRPYKWVSKKSNFRLPIIGWIMVLNDYVAVVRGDRDSVQHMIDHCARHLRNGSPVLLFPEGTRSRDGRLQQFKDGAFQIAMQEKCPVFPIVIHGTAQALPKNGFFFRNRMDARVEVLPPLDPAAFRSVEALRDAAHSAIGARLEQFAKAA